MVQIIVRETDGNTVPTMREILKRSILEENRIHTEVRVGSESFESDILV